MDFYSPTLENMEVVNASTQDITPVGTILLTQQNNSNNEASRRLEQARSSFHDSKMNVDTVEAMDNGNTNIPLNIFGNES